MMEPEWLRWAKQLQAIAQNGLTFARDPFDIERYQAVRQIAAEMLAFGSTLDISQVLDLFTEETGYATPKLDVRGAVFQDEAILLVRERSDQRWTLPGGWADVGESPSESVVREIYEESGYRTQAIKLVALYDRHRHPHVPLAAQHIYKCFFLCKLVDGTAVESIETDGVAFFGEDELPDLSLARVTQSQIVRMFEHHRNPGLPTEFD